MSDERRENIAIRAMIRLHYWRSGCWGMDKLLNQLALDKMAVILTDDKFKDITLIKTTEFRFEFQRNLFPGAPVDNEQALVQVMALCRTGDKPLPEVMLTQFTDAFMRHYGIWVKSIITCDWTTYPIPNFTDEAA